LDFILLTDDIYVKPAPLLILKLNSVFDDIAYADIGMSLEGNEIYGMSAAAALYPLVLRIEHKLRLAGARVFCSAFKHLNAVELNVPAAMLRCC